MANTFKNLTANDVTSTRTLLYEAIPLTGALVSGTYGTWALEENIKNYSHGMFQSCYDYPYLSSSANNMFDITLGFASDSALSMSTPGVQQEKKINLYNQMCQLLMGYDHTGSIQEFDEDGNILAGGTKIKEAYFLTFSRLLYKDEIKKGSFSITIGTKPLFTIANSTTYVITDGHAASDYRVNSPAGEYAILTGSTPIAGSKSPKCGLIFYQAGVVVLTASLFNSITASGGGGSVGNQGGYQLNTCIAVPPGTTGGTNFENTFTGSTIQVNADALRHRIHNISFNNTTELNSTIYFVRANHSEFNYSSNPTFVTGSKIRVKTNTYDEPVTYITTIGLYSADNELLAIAKLSEPLKKTPSNEIIFRTRLDF